jgi:hypothetical protein
MKSCSRTKPSLKVKRPNEPGASKSVNWASGIWDRELHVVESLPCRVKTTSPTHAHSKAFAK